MMLKITCVLILGIFACTKVNQWKQPTKVCFNVNLEEGVAAEGQLIFKSGYLMIESFQFDGKRKEGADVYFSKEYSNGLNAELGTMSIEDLSFDIPQGIYHDIRVEVVSKSNNLPNLVVNGDFETKDGVLLPVRFEFSETEVFEIMGKDLTGTDVNLIENSKSSATIWLNPAKWFDAVSAMALQDAQRVTLEGEHTILINKSTNTQIYNGVVKALESIDQEAIFIRQ